MSLSSPSKRKSQRQDLFYKNLKDKARLNNPEFTLEMRDVLRSGVDEEEARKPVIEGSRVKVVVSGHVVEVWEYEEPVRTGKREAPDSELLVDEETGEIVNREAYDPLEAKKHNARRAKNELRRLIIANFDSLTDKFVTLTFRDGSVSDVKDVRACNQAFMIFIKRMRRRYGNFSYVKVIEFQDSNGRGAVHFHVIAKLPYIKSEILEEIWGNGFVNITQIEHVDNLGAYVTKYMVKDFADMRLAGEKAYTTSKGLVRPITLYGADALEIIEGYLENKKEVFTNSYVSEYQGQVTYKEFNMNRKDTPT